MTAGAAAVTIAGGCAPEPATPTALVPGEPAAADLDGDAEAELVLIDPEGCYLSIEDGPDSYCSRDKWRLVQGFLGDTDLDGLPEVVALVDSMDGRHLALFAFFGGRYRERFVSQALEPAPMAIEVVPAGSLPQLGWATDGDATASTGDLVLLLQGPDTDYDAAQATVLQWNGFGFTRIEPISP